MKPEITTYFCHPVGDLIPNCREIQMHRLGVNSSPDQRETKKYCLIPAWWWVDRTWNLAKSSYSAGEGNRTPATTKSTKPGSAREPRDKKNPSLPHLAGEGQPGDTLLTTVCGRAWLTSSILKTKKFLQIFVLTASGFYACLKISAKDSRHLYSTMYALSSNAWWWKSHCSSPWAELPVKAHFHLYY